MVKKNSLIQLFNTKKNGLDNFRKSMAEEQQCCIMVSKILYTYTPGMDKDSSGYLTKQDGNNIYEYNKKAKTWNKIQ